MSNEISMTNKHDSPAPPYSTVEPGQNSQANIQNGAAYPVNHQNHEQINSAPYQNEAQHHTNGTKPIHSVPNVPVEPTASVTPLKLLREQPAYIDCPCCRSRQKTRPEEKDSGMTWIAVGVTFVICPCVACLPLNCCMGWLQDVDHYCEGCGERITHKPYDREVQVLHHGVNGTQPSQYATQPQPVYSPESRK